MDGLNLPEESVFKDGGGVKDGPDWFVGLIAHDRKEAREEVMGVGGVGVIIEVLQRLGHATKSTF